MFDKNCIMDPLVQLKLISDGYAKTFLGWLFGTGFGFIEKSRPIGTTIMISHPISAGENRE